MSWAGQRRTQVQQVESSPSQRPSQPLSLFLRLPLLASCHRPAVLRQWASVCGGTAPQEVLLDFRTVRSLSPEAFVDLLADQLRVKGVVAGTPHIDAGWRLHLVYWGFVDPWMFPVFTQGTCDWWIRVCALLAFDGGFFEHTVRASTSPFRDADSCRRPICKARTV